MPDGGDLKVFHVFRRHDVDDHMSSGNKLLGTFYTFREARKDARCSLIRGDEGEYEEYREGRKGGTAPGPGSWGSESGDRTYLSDKEDDKNGIQDFCIDTLDCEGETEHIWVEEGTLYAFREPTDDEAEDESEDEHEAPPQKMGSIPEAAVDENNEKTDVAPEKATETVLGDPQVPVGSSSNSSKRKEDVVDLQEQSFAPKRSKEVIEIDSSSDEE